MANDEKKMYEVTVYSENQMGLLSSLSNIFTRRNVDIASLRVFPSEIAGIPKTTIKGRATAEEMAIVIRLIEKRVGVLKAFCYEDDDRHNRELAVVRGLIEERMKKINK